jgi:hypothetical protein
VKARGFDQIEEARVVPSHARHAEGNVSASAKGMTTGKNRAATERTRPPRDRVGACLCQTSVTDIWHGPKVTYIS